MKRKTVATDRAETVHLSTTARRCLVDDLEKAKEAFWRAYSRLQRYARSLDKAKGRMERLARRIAREGGAA
jgi:hypothetical protein